MNSSQKYYHTHKAEIRERRRIAYAESREADTERRRRLYAAAPPEVVAKRLAKVACPHCGVDKAAGYMKQHMKRCKQRP